MNFNSCAHVLTWMSMRCCQYPHTGGAKPSPTILLRTWRTTLPFGLPREAPIMCTTCGSCCARDKRILYYTHTHPPIHTHTYTHTHAVPSYSDVSFSMRPSPRTHTHHVSVRGVFPRDQSNNPYRACCGLLLPVHMCACVSPAGTEVITLNSGQPRVSPTAMGTAATSTRTPCPTSPNERTSPDFTPPWQP